MSEQRTTLVYVAVALALVVLAFVFSPRKITPDAFLDQGEQFFPAFTDPNEAVSLEVVTYDSVTGSTYPFKVSFEGGRWVIPSHNNYPADAQDRLAKTAAGVIDIKKDDYRTDNVTDHEICGVIDPLDESTTALSGRGKRVTIKGQNEKILADLIIGNKVQGRENFRFVRVPDQKRVYAVRMDVDISSNFADWIDTDLLKINQKEIDKVVLKDYSINERTMSIDLRDNLELTLKDSTWTANNMKKSEMVDSVMMLKLLSALDNLNIVGVLSKPEGLAKILQDPSGQNSITMQDQISLQGKGFFFTRSGQLYSNEGELQVYTQKGVIYNLRFGEVVFGSGLAAVGGIDDSKSKDETAENRYLFITAAFDEKKNNDDKEKEEGRLIVNEANIRFADWFYVIPAGSFENLRLGRRDLVVPKGA